MNSLALNLPDYESIEVEGLKLPNTQKPPQTLGDILNALLPYLFVLAGLLLFAAIIIAGFKYLTATGDPKKAESAKGCLTSAVIGFSIVIIAYFLIQIFQHLLGLSLGF